MLRGCLSDQVRSGKNSSNARRVNLLARSAPAISHCHRFDEPHLLLVVAAGHFFAKYNVAITMKLFIEYYSTVVVPPSLPSTPSPFPFHLEVCANSFWPFEDGADMRAAVRCCMRCLAAVVVPRRVVFLVCWSAGASQRILCVIHSSTAVHSF